MKRRSPSSHSMVLLIAFAVRSAVTMSTEIHWRAAEAGETQAETCLRNNLDPLYMGDYGLNWNESVFRDVVTNILGRKVDNSTNDYGVNGCCAPGLWCDDDSCFTQGFASEFSNYGWLSGDTTSIPVYTCTGTSSNSASISSTVISNGVLSAFGIGFSSTEIDTAAYVYGEMCNLLETCNCHSCSAASPACPPGHLCFQLNEDVTPFCFLLCTGPEDDSCPCDQTCMRAYGEGDAVTSLCISNAAYLGHVSTCMNTAGQFKCNAARAYQSSYVAESENDKEYSVSLSMGSDGAAHTEGITSTNHLKDGFCSSDADCADGDLCTTDQCNTGTKLCSYSTVEGCSSMLPAIAARQAPYMYYTYYSSSAAVAATQASSVDTLLDLGTESSVSDHDDYPLQELALPFDVVFFGNLASTVYISANGQLALPPQPVCESAQCHYLSSSTNAISPFTADWNPHHSPHGQVVYYFQNASDGTPIFGVSATALHVLYDKVIRYYDPKDAATADMSENSFAASLYSDSSVRLSFIDISTDFKVSDFMGLWGAFASGSEDPTGKYLRYHQESVSTDDVTSGTEMVYCPLAALACPVETCVAPGEELQVRWNGTASCAALGSDYRFEFTCAFAGGVVSTPATLTPAVGDDFATVSCAVPELSFLNDTVLAVDIIVKAVLISGTSDVEYTQNKGDGAGSKVLYGAYIGGKDELARSSLLLRYYSASNVKPAEGCGCNALPGFSGLACDAMSVCGGNDATVDCAGVPFGNALSTNCQRCSGGLTGIAPNYACADDDNSSSVANLISQAIILLMIICCLVFLTMSVTYSIRRMMAMRALTDDLQRFNEQLVLAEHEILRRQRNGVMSAVARGLTEFECDALGQVTFTKEFYEKHKKEQLALIHAADTTPTKIHEVDAISTIEEGTTELGTNGSTSAEVCECTICLSEIEEGTLCRVLPAPCGHIFHVACIDQWFAQSFLCPLCKRSIRAILLGNDTELMVRNREQPATDFLFNHNGFSFRLTSMRPAPGIFGTMNARSTATTQSTRSVPEPAAAADEEEGLELGVVPVRYARQSRRAGDGATSRPFVYNRDSNNTSAAASAEDIRAPVSTAIATTTATGGANDRSRILYRELETSRNSSDELRDSSENLNSGSP